MPWYYANNNQRLGPVNDTEFARLAREKVIRGDTLVWQHGMPDWKAFSEVEPTLPAVEAPPPPVPQESAGGSSVDVAAIMALQPVRLDYAGFWVRVVAKFADLMIVSGLVMMVAGAMGQLPTLPQQPDLNDVAKFVAEMSALSRMTFLVELFYTFFFIWRFQATPGKMVLGLKVVNPDGSRLKLLRILTRFVFEMLNRILFSFGYLSAVFDSEKRTMHDFLCDTRVIRRRR